MTATVRRPALRCAIYTRKSSEEGLEQSFNSLHAQREACEAYIKSQGQEGWRLVRDAFDDGGYSGGTLDRPALQRLLDKVRACRIDVIVVYKIDRLTRSLSDFARLAETFEQRGVSFVSVTQQFNTTTSMGRLMLNVLLSFAQFEREVTGERIRDKIAASKKKGMWMGGNVPLGYDAKDRMLVINESEAETVRALYRLYQKHGTVRTVTAEAEALGLRSKVRLGPDGHPKGGGSFSRGHIYRILANPLYAGRIAHGDETYPGLHAPIVDPETWQAVQRQLAGNRNGERIGVAAGSSSLLMGLLVDRQGIRYTPSHAIKAGRRYRYYVERALISGTEPSRAKLHRIPAMEIETLVREAIADLLARPNRLLAALGGDLVSGDIDRVIERVRDLRTRILDRHGRDPAYTIRPLLHEVMLDEACVCIRIDRAALQAALGVTADRHQEPHYEFEVRTRVTTRGERLKLVFEDGSGEARREPDPVLIKTVARAHDWLRRLASGDAASVKDIAAADGVSGSYVTRVLRLAFLAPDLVEAILDGRQPVELTTKRLLLLGDLPLGWQEQRHRLGFTAE